MGKMMYGILTVFAIEFALYFFVGNAIPNTSLFQMLFDPSTITDSPLKLFITLTFTTLAAGVIVAGVVFKDPSTALYAAVGIVVMGFIVSLGNLYVFSCAQLDPLIGTPGSPCDGLAFLISILITAPLITWYLWTSMEWIRSNQ